MKLKNIHRCIKYAIYSGSIHIQAFTYMLFMFIKQATFIMFMTIYKENTIAELNTRILSLRISFPATSYVAATFHPTIGQCAPYSLSITATPELGMISTRN